MKVAILADAHANNKALIKILSLLEDKVDALIYAGDFLGYGPQPTEVIETLMDLSMNKFFCLGNHDIAICKKFAFQNDYPTKDFSKPLERYQFNQSAELMITKHANEITEEHFYFLKNLKIKNVFTLDKKKIYLTHGSPSKKIEENVGKYVRPPPMTSVEIIKKIIDSDKKAKKADVIIIGHSHQRFIFNLTTHFHWSLISDKLLHKKTTFPITINTFDSKILLNPGSVGQPRDGTTESSFVIIDFESEKTTFYKSSYYDDDFKRLIMEKCLEETSKTSFWLNEF